MHRTVLLFALALPLAACSPDPAPTAPVAAKHDELSKAMHEPLDKAKAVDAAAQADVAAKERALDEATGASEPAPSSPPQ